jgi:hypothetical protein
LRGPARPLLAGLDDALSDLVAPERMRRTIQEHLSGAADHRRRLWSAVTVARWRARG